MIRFFISALLLSMGLMISGVAHAEGSDNTPLEVGLFPPLQIPGSGFGVKGIRLTVVGANREMRGLDIGLLGNMTDVQFKGIALAGLVNYNRGGATVIGLQFAGLANINTGPSDVYGVQVALYNSAVNVYGFQLGLINVATELHGIQIGLVNINKNGPFHVSPIINASF